MRSTQVFFFLFPFFKGLVWISNLNTVSGAGHCGIFMHFSEECGFKMTLTDIIDNNYLDRSPIYCSSSIKKKASGLICETCWWFQQALLETFRPFILSSKFDLVVAASQWNGATSSLLPNEKNSKSGCLDDLRAAGVGWGCSRTRLPAKQPSLGSGHTGLRSLQKSTAHVAYFSSSARPACSVNVAEGILMLRR